MNEQSRIEECGERALYEIESSEFEKSSPHKKDKVRKELRSVIQYLKDNHPDSYFLKMKFPEGF